MGKIKHLPEQVINQIAAGEVIERPASVVKELVENSLDAGATEVTVELENAGKKLIRIIDNGSGMDEEDLNLSLSRHATSKLGELNDLWELETLGFRGEALASIASVSRFSISSRQESSSHGFERVGSGDVQPVARPVGTTISVEGIFGEIPARRKFLKSDQTELSYIGEIVDRLALSYPSVRFCLKHKGRILKDYLPSTHPLDRVKAVMSRELKEIDESELIPLEANSGDLVLQGILWPSKITKSTSQRILTLVNKRPVRDRLLSHAILQGYQSLIEPRRWPIVVLYVDLDPKLVDVNVHPAKAEVRFVQPGVVHDVVASTVREALSQYRGTTKVTPEDFSQKYAPNVVRQKPNPYIAPSLEKPSSEKSVEPEQILNLFGEEEKEEGTFSQLRIIGQAAKSYIVCEKEGALVIIDQHAAHERVKFEQLREEYTEGNISSQLLLVSEWLGLTESETTALLEHSDQLSKFGLDIEAFGTNSITIKAVPSVLGDQPAKSLVESLLTDLLSVSRTGGLEEQVNRVLATIACHSAIRFNKALTMEEMQELLKQLDKVELISNCPHGRPIVTEIPLKDLAREVHRG
ncbi:DNA mismatch repair endonuclease MutL [Bdellovibrionota bacterium]